MTMPLLMVLAEYRWLRAGRLTDLKLAKRWQTATAILFRSWSTLRDDSCF